MDLEDLVLLDLTVVMATIPERRELRQEALDSLEDQTVKPVQVKWELDRNHRGVVPTFNSAAKNVKTTWLFPFADDDLLDPNHFEVLGPHLTDDVDIVYTWCRLTGRPDIPENIYQIHIDTQEEFHNRLMERNFIPGSAAIRTSLWRELGGYRDKKKTPHEDWDFWVRCLKKGARFLCVPQVTWTYRIDPTWHHASSGKGAG